MSIDELYCEEPFSYQDTKSGLVLISYKGKVVTTLSGKHSLRFLAKVEPGDNQAAQLAMAKATGHFKHGTERPARDDKEGK